MFGGLWGYWCPARAFRVAGAGRGVPALFRFAARVRIASGSRPWGYPGARLVRTRNDYRPCGSRFAHQVSSVKIRGAPNRPPRTPPPPRD